jgi:CHRD domain
VKKLASLVVAGATVALVVVALAPAAGLGESYKVSASLRNNTEVPRAKGAPLAKGSFTGTYVENKSGATLTWKLTFSHLTGAAAAAHIHKGARGTSGPVVVPLCGPCKNGQTGKVHISKAVISALESGKAYVNVHTAKNPGGEIRNQIKVAES